ncbi:exported hypothetical protein [Cupriavidus taiwanensis]|uniref:Uncharacterized protein n=1 Tax=Cupriavidus taiwanensis TaxID=164546 RepID=A0A375I710_9BURK|nr:exported hypothetical protein [Cupriavidus taiwanensis]
MSRSSARIVIVMVSGLHIAASSLGQTESRQHASLGKGVRHFYLAQMRHYNLEWPTKPCHRTALDVR